MATERPSDAPERSRSAATAPFGELPVTPDPPEPPRREDRKLDRKALRKKLKLTDAELDEALALAGFPAAGQRVTYGGWGTTPIWSETAVDRWVEKQRALAATITRLLGRRNTAPSRCRPVGAGRSIERSLRPVGFFREVLEI
jgi:hypothetical protein